MTNKNVTPEIENTNVDVATPEMVANEPQTAEQQAAEAAEDATLNPVQRKAKQVLRATFPNLKAAGLNFEKRTGNFFVGVVEKVAKLNNDGTPRTNAKGEIIYEIDADGRTVQKLRRIVVDLTETVENADGTSSDTGVLKPEYQAAAEEINAKRAAALVLDAEKKRKRLEKDHEDALKAVAAAEEALETFDADLQFAEEIVNGVQLPERETAVREKVAEIKSERDELAAKNAALREKLLALGIDPDTM